MICDTCSWMLPAVKMFGPTFSVVYILYDINYIGLE